MALRYLQSLAFTVQADAYLYRRRISPELGLYLAHVSKQEKKTLCIWRDDLSDTVHTRSHVQ